MKFKPVPVLTRLLLWCFLFAPGAFSTATAADPFTERLQDELLQPLVSEAPGAAVVVVIDGRVALQKSWGVRSADDPRPVTPYTLFRLASVSKTFAAAAGSILVREQPIEWDTPVTSSLDTLQFKRPDYGERISLRHLMSQSTGLMPHAYTNLIEDNMAYDRIIGRLERVDFICAPGECYGYQNVVFSLIGDVVEATTQTDYQTFVAEKLFEPLQMRRASYGRSAFINDRNHAEPHIWDGRTWSPTRTTDHYYRVAPAAGVNASIDDMKLWLLAQLGHNPEVLSADMLDEMQTGVIPTSRQQAHYRRRAGLGEVYYGLGWRVFDYGGEQGFVHHGGYVRGMRSEMIFNRQLQLGLVYLTNSEPRQLRDLVFDFIDLYREHRETLPLIVRHGD